MKVLLVEDDAIVCRVLTNLLSAECEVEVATNGRTAVEGFSSGQYDLAIIDLGIPGIPGDQVAQQLRRVDSKLVMALITGFGLAADDARLELFDMSYEKPVSMAQLKELIDRAVVLLEGRAQTRS